MKKVKNGLISKVSSLVVIGMALLIIILFTNNIAQAAEGDSWITPSNEGQGTSQNFDVRVYIDTGTKHLNSFNMYLDFDPAKITVDTSQGEDPGADDGRGFHNGADTQNYIMGSNSNDINNGHFRFAGMKGAGGTRGSNQHLITIHLKTTA